MIAFSKKNDIFTTYNAHRKKSLRKCLCYAPFRSLRFSQSGRVLVCCFNRGYTLGRYPDETIHDIWFGEKMKNFRERILKNDLSLGCTECSERIEKKLFELSGSLQYDYLAQYAESFYPQMLDFELSNICNLKCVMCTGENSSLIRAEREQLTPYVSAYDKNFVRQLGEFIPYLKEARFSGGEPFLIPLYYDIWNLITDINPSTNISVLTNTTVLNDSIKQLLEKANFQISVSIDSFEKKTYESIRENAAIEKVKENMAFFYDYSQRKNKNFCINVCPGRRNWHEIPSIVNYCNEQNIQLVLHTLVFPPAEALWSLDTRSLMKIEKVLSSEKIKCTSKISEKNLKVFENFKVQVKEWLKTAYLSDEKKISLTNKTEDELFSILSNHIYHETDSYFSTIRSLLLNSEINTEPRKKILIQLLSFRPELIISEIQHSDKERLLLRLKMLNF